MLLKKNNLTETVSSEDDDEDSEESDVEELKTLGLPADDLSIADIISKANQQADNKIKVGSFYQVFKNVYSNRFLLSSLMKRMCSY